MDKKKLNRKLKRIKNKNEAANILRLMLIAIVIVCVAFFFIGKWKTTSVDASPPANDTPPVSVTPPVVVPPVVVPDEPIAVIPPIIEPEPEHKVLKAQPLAASATVDTTYFDDALFIGDSRTQAFQLFSGLKNSIFFASKGMDVKLVFKEAIPINGKKQTIINAIPNTKFSKVYIMFGVNELGWTRVDIFIKHFSDIIDAIIASHPDAIIYVQSIIPVSKAKNASSDIYTNANVRKFNKEILAMCIDKNVVYLDLDEFTKNKDGELFEDASTDGIHLTKPYCAKWLDFLKTHTITKDDYKSLSKLSTTTEEE